MSPTPAVPAVVVPFSQKNVELHRAAQIHTVSSGSSKISIVSSGEREIRQALARAKRELADSRVEQCKARVDEVQCDLDVVVGSKASSIGRHHDIQSEVGSTTPVVEPAEPLIRLNTDVALKQHNVTQEHSQTNFEGVFAPARLEEL